MAKLKKVYRSLRGNNYMIARKDKEPDKNKDQAEQALSLPPIVFSDGLYSTSNPEEIAFIESLKDFGRGIKLHGAGSGAGVKSKKKETKKSASNEEKTILVDSVSSLNEAVEFLTGRGVPTSELKTKKDVACIATKMGISFPNFK